jgi:UrcA family protein
MTMFRIIALSTAAVLLAAGSASASDRVVRYGDLDLSTPTGATQFDARIMRAAVTTCAAYTGLRRRDCQSAFQKEAIRQLPSAARVDYARARAAFDI